MLHTRCILVPREPGHRYRISVMSRHTLTDGFTPDPRITRDLWDMHDIILAPSPKLVGGYYRSLQDARTDKEALGVWKRFEDSFRDYLEDLTVKREIARIAELALTRSVTLLCIEDRPQRCHRRLLAEACQEHIPDLALDLQ